MFDYDYVKSLLPVRQQRYSMRFFVDATLDAVDTTVLANARPGFYKGSQLLLFVGGDNLLASNSPRLKIENQIETSVDLVDHQLG